MPTHLDGQTALLPARGADGGPATGRQMEQAPQLGRTVMRRGCTGWVKLARGQRRTAGAASDERRRLERGRRPGRRLATIAPPSAPMLSSGRVSCVADGNAQHRHAPTLRCAGSPQAARSGGTLHRGGKFVNRRRRGPIGRAARPHAAADATSASPAGGVCLLAARATGGARQCTRDQAES